MSKINYITGDATQPQENGKKVIAHVCNDIGKWGAGFVIALSKKWKEPETRYRSTPVDSLKLGLVQFIRVQEEIIVANMVAQHGVRSNDNKQPLKYDALMIALKEVNDFCEKEECTLHMPKIGAGLAGGDWSIIKDIIEDNVQVPVYIYLFD